MKLKQLPILALLAVLCCPLFSGFLFAQLNFEYDINTQSASTQINYCVTINGVLYFSSNDGYFGNELWKFDPATEQTTRLTDIRKLNGNSSPYQITGYDNKVFFRSQTDDRNTQLFYYDPTNGQVKQATPFNFEDFGIASLVVFREKLWFTAQWQGRVNLWSYSAETGIFEEIMAPGFGNQTYFYPDFMAEHNGFLYGMCRDTAYKDLVFRYDPDTGVFTHEPTQFDNNPVSFGVQKFVSCEGKLLMRVHEGPFAKRRWYLYEAEADSCILLHTDDVNIDREVACFANKFWFADFPKAHVFDPATNQTALLNTVTSNAPNGISDIREINGALYCSGYTGSILNAIYKLNATTQTWEYQPYFNAISANIKTVLSTVTPYQNTLYAVAYPTNNYDFEIYKYTPGANSAARITDINQATQDAAQIAQFVEFDNRMLFTAFDSGTYKIWQKDLINGEYAPFLLQPTGGGWNLKISTTAKVGDRLYGSSARKNGNFQQLWSYSAGEDSLRLHGNSGDLTQIGLWVLDILTMTAHDSILYLVSAREEGNSDSLRIFQFDTRTDSFSLLAGAEHLHYANELTILQDKLYFWTPPIVNSIENNRLWVHDLAENLNEIPLDTFLYPEKLLAINGKLVFNCKTNPFPFYYENTIGMYDPNTGVLSAIQPPGYRVRIEESVVFQNQLWFYDDNFSDTLFYLDPGTGQCDVALDLTPFNVKISGKMAVFNQKLYFQGYTFLHGSELWEYDPGTGNVRQYADINPGGGHSSVDKFACSGASTRAAATATAATDQ